MVVKSGLSPTATQLLSLTFSSLWKHKFSYWTMKKKKSCKLTGYWAVWPQNQWYFWIINATWSGSAFHLQRGTLTIDSVNWCQIVKCLLILLCKFDCGFYPERLREVAIRFHVHPQEIFAQNWLLNPRTSGRARQFYFDTQTLRTVD